MARKRSKKSSGIFSALQYLQPYLQIVFGLLLAFSIAFILRGISNPLHYLNTHNIEQMKDVFLNNESNWVVMCKKSADIVPKMFENTARNFKDYADFGVLDCGGTLPSGKTVYSKFELNKKIKPVVFAVTQGSEGKPVQAQAKHILSENDFSRWVSSKVEPHSYLIKSSKTLKERCLKKDKCILLMKAGPISNIQKESIKSAMNEHSSVSFATIDSSRYELSIEPKLKFKYKEGKHVALYFNKLGDDVESKKKITQSWKIGYFNDDMSALNDWIVSLETTRKNELTNVNKVVTMKRRAKVKPKVVDIEETKAETSQQIKEKIMEELKRKQTINEIEKRLKMEKEGQDVVVDLEEQEEEEEDHNNEEWIDLS